MYTCFCGSIYHRGQVRRATSLILFLILFDAGSRSPADASEPSCPAIDSACAGTYVDFIERPPGETDGPSSGFEAGYPYQGCGRKPSDSTYAGCGCSTFVDSTGTPKCKTPCNRLGSHSCRDGTSVSDPPESRCTTPEQLSTYKSYDGCTVQCPNRWPCKPGITASCTDPDGAAGITKCVQPETTCSAWGTCEAPPIRISVNIRRIRGPERIDIPLSAPSCSDLQSTYFADDVEDGRFAIHLNPEAPEVRNGNRIRVLFKPSAEIYIPQWTERRTRPNGERRAFQQARKGAIEHEEGHINATVTSAFPILKATLEGISKTTVEAAVAEINSVIAQWSETTYLNVRDAYDAATHDGRDQIVLTCPPL